MTAIAQEWQRCRPWIEAALHYCHETHTIEDVEVGLASNQYILWPGMRSAIISEIWQYPRARFLHLPWGGGDLDEIREMIKRLLHPYAFLMGCSRITLMGRRGWERALRSDGWQPDMICLGLQINGACHGQFTADKPKHVAKHEHSGMASVAITAAGAAAE